MRFVHLKGDYDTIASRIANRAHRYMPPTLLASQFATLEEPKDAIVVDVRDAIAAQVAKIRAALKLVAKNTEAPDGSSRRDVPNEPAKRPHERRQAQPATRAVHLGRNPRKYLGAVNTPVFRASTMLFPTVAELDQAALGQYAGIGYGLHGLPTVTDLQAAVAAIEGAHAALAVPSGLTATTLPLLALLRAGDHVLVTDAVYGPTRRFCDLHLTRLGVEVSYYDPLAGAAIEREFRPNTRVVFTESPGSLTFEVQDIPAIAAVAHRAGRARDPRQHVGDAARLPLVRPRRRRVGARRDQVHRRALGRAARAHRRQRGDVPGAAPAVDGHGRDRVARRLLPRPARPAHAAVAARAALSKRARRSRSG